MMNFEEFKMRVVNEVARRLGNKQVKLQKIVKNNSVQKTALLIMSEDVNISPVIYLDEFYMQMSNKSFEEVLKSIWEKCEEKHLVSI